jgi:hypothetical protein
MRNAIGMNCGGAAFGPFNYANAVIGRAWTLMSINFGDARLGDTFMATLGNGLSYNNMVCGENEEKNPWQPFHVQQGFKPEESTISLFRGWNVINLGIGGSEGILNSMKSLGMMMGNFTMLLDPLVAKTVYGEGFTDLKKLKEWIIKKANAPFPMNPDKISFFVVGGETNPIYATTDYIYSKTWPVDKWIPKNGLKKDAKPIRMPVPKACADGSCGMDG